MDGLLLPLALLILGVPLAGLMLAGTPWGKWAGVGAGAAVIVAVVGFASLHAVVV